MRTAKAALMAETGGTLFRVGLAICRRFVAARMLGFVLASVSLQLGTPA